MTEAGKIKALEAVVIFFWWVMTETTGAGYQHKTITAPAFALRVGRQIIGYTHVVVDDLFCGFFIPHHFTVAISNR